MINKSIFVLIISTLLLSGCQQGTIYKSSLPTPEQQREQLSSLIGASQFLREKCNRTDILSDEKLAAAALSEAKKKGWKNARLNQSELLDAANDAFNSLNADTTPLKEKCSRFNQSLAPFLAQTR